MGPLHVALNAIELIGPVAHDANQFNFFLCWYPIGHISIVATTKMVLMNFTLL